MLKLHFQQIQAGAVRLAEEGVKLVTWPNVGWVSDQLVSSKGIVIRSAFLIPIASISVSRSHTFLRTSASSARPFSFPQSLMLLSGVVPWPGCFNRSFAEYSH